MAKLPMVLPPVFLVPLAVLVHAASLRGLLGEPQASALFFDETLQCAR
jgi:hypothetical protein